MSRGRTALFSLVILVWGVPGARGDSGTTTIISAQGDALSRSKSADSLATAMPSAPPAYSGAGAPVYRVSPPVPAAAPAPAALVPAVPAPAASDAHGPLEPVLIMDTRDSPGKVMVSRGKRPAAVPGEASLADRKGRRLEVIPQKASPAEIGRSAVLRRRIYKSTLGAGALVLIVSIMAL